MTFIILNYDITFNSPHDTINQNKLYNHGDKMKTKELVAVLSTFGVLASTVPHDSKPSDNTKSIKTQIKSKSPEK